MSSQFSQINEDECSSEVEIIAVQIIRAYENTIKKIQQISDRLRESFIRYQEYKTAEDVKWMADVENSTQQISYLEKISTGLMECAQGIRRCVSAPLMMTQHDVYQQ